MGQLRPDRISDQSITNALLCLRAEIVREGKPGLEHVNALLALRGALPNAPVPRKTDRRFKRGKLAAMIASELRSGALTGREIAERVAARHGRLTAGEAYERVYGCLARMRRAGLAVCEDGLWRLAEQQRPHADHDQRPRGDGER